MISVTSGGVGRIASLLTVLLSGCGNALYGPTYYDDRTGVNTEYYNYPSNPYHEESYYYRGSPYDPQHKHHHHGY